jgi:hypothetical protein
MVHVYRRGCSAGVTAGEDGQHSGAEKGTIMEFLFVATIAITGLGLIWYLRTRTAY